MNTKDQAKEVYKSDLQTSDEMVDLLDGHSPEEISEASMEVVQELLEKVEDDRRVRTVFATTFQLAKAIGDQQMAEFAQAGLEQQQDG